MLKRRIPRIFVVDDEAIIAKTLAIILERAGFSTRYFTSPLPCLEACHSDVPDLLISDVTMPELSGIDLAIELQQRCPGCKVLLFSGESRTADLLLVAREQGHDFHLLPKPIHPHDMLRAIRGQNPQWFDSGSEVQCS